MFLTLAVVLFIVAQFTARGQAFLSTPMGALATVVLAAVAILSMLPGLLMGNPLSLILVGLWCYIAYPRLDAAKLGVKELVRKLR